MVWSPVMKTHLSSALFCIVLVISSAGCENPCEKAYKKTLKCTPKEGIQKSVANHKDVVLRLCSPYKDEVKACLKYEDCVKFSNCMINATSPLRAKKLRSRHDEAPAKSESPKKKPAPMTGGSGFKLK